MYKFHKDNQHTILTTQINISQTLKEVLAQLELNLLFPTSGHGPRPKSITKVAKALC